MTFHYLSICSGIEAATAAVHALGWTPAGFAEIEAFPCAVLAERHGSNKLGEALSHNAPPNFGDFTQIDLTRLGTVDVLIGGTPCQAFSIAGRRLSLADARGNLTLSFVVLAHELARSHGLRNVWWENVPGILSTDDNAFGCFLGALVGSDAPCVSPLERGRWPDIGMVAGPAGRAAWRVLDAQYFGLAQRRRRVFVVADLGAGADPAAVLFEPQGLRGHPPARGEARQGTARDAAAGAGERRAFGGGHCADVAATLNAAFHDKQGLENQHIDGGASWFVAHALRGEGFDASEDGTGRGTPIVPVKIAPRFTCQSCGSGFGVDDYPRNPTCPRCGSMQCRDVFDEDGGGQLAVAFPERLSGTQYASSGDVSPSLQALNPTAVAYAIQERAVSENLDHGPNGMGVREDVAYTLEAREKVQAVAYDLRGREGGAQFEGPRDTANLRAASGGSSRSYVATRWAVRRLTPTECERLQGFQDGHTAIPWRGKPADQCPDGPRYKALGNSMAVPVMAWIGRRLDAELRKAKP